MAITKTTVAVDNITSLSSTPNATEGLTAAQLQAKFDKTGADLKKYINDTLTVEAAPLSSPTFTGTVTLPSTTSIGDVSSTELAYLNGVTSAIQTQFASVLTYRGLIVVDFNNYTTTGLYQFTGANITNRPTNFGTVIVLHANEYISQVCIGSTAIVFRVTYDTGANWSAWKYLY